jgi:hypothetical protein
VRRADQLASFLSREERILLVGSAQWVQLAERVGRGGGEGMLAMTNSRIFHAVLTGATQGVTFSLPLSQVVERWSTWIIAPLMRELHLSFVPGGTDGSWLATNLAAITGKNEASFYAGRRLCREIAAASIASPN